MKKTNRCFLSLSPGAATTNEDDLHREILSLLFHWYRDNQIWGDLSARTTEDGENRLQSMIARRYGRRSLRRAGGGGLGGCCRR